MLVTGRRASEVLVTKITCMPMDAVIVHFQSWKASKWSVAVHAVESVHSVNMLLQRLLGSKLLVAGCARPVMVEIDVCIELILGSEAAVAINTPKPVRFLLM